MHKIIIRLFFFLPCIFVFPAILQAQTEPVAPDSLTVTAKWNDENGTNFLKIEIRALCIPNKTHLMGFESNIRVSLKNRKHEVNIGYELEDYQMQMLLFYKEDVRYFDIKRVRAVFIPFFYCGNSDSTIRVSYIIMYDDKAYLKHIDFNCSEDGKCTLPDDLPDLSDLPKSLRKKLMQELERYRDVSDFHEDNTDIL